MREIEDYLLSQLTEWLADGRAESWIAQELRTELSVLESMTPVEQHAALQDLAQDAWVAAKLRHAAAEGKGILDPASIEDIFDRAKTKVS